MTSFFELPVRRDPELLRAHRESLLSQPDSFYREVFQGRLPSLDEKLAWLERATALMIPDRAFRNDTYEVQMNLERPFIHLDIRRHDGGTITQWREMQQIKNELVGPEHEAVELFPAESRLVDTGNQYHLWVYADPVTRFPLGWPRRCVLAEPAATATVSVKASGHDSVAGKAGIGLKVNGLTVSLGLRR